MNFHDIMLFAAAYAIVFVITIFPFFFYAKKNDFVLKINKESRKYVSYALFLIISEFFLIVSGNVFSESGFSLYESYTKYRNMTIFALLNANIFAPIGEEILFRSHSAKLAEKFEFKKRGVVILSVLTSLMWALFHYDLSPYFVIHTFVFGFILFHLRFESKSILICIILHAISNLSGTLAFEIRDW